MTLSFTVLQRKNWATFGMDVCAIALLEAGFNLFSTYVVLHATLYFIRAGDSSVGVLWLFH
jgi:hypothetical protein